MPQMDPELFECGQFQAELELKESITAAFKKAICHLRGVLYERFLTLLCDIRLEVSQNVRSADELAGQERPSPTIITNPMESSTVNGLEYLRRRMFDFNSTTRMWHSNNLSLAKRLEQKSRRRKYSDTEYYQKPKVKGSPGGLREIQTTLWPARRQYGTLNLSAPAGEGFLVERKRALLGSSQEFLWKVRYALNMLARRSENYLMFNHQCNIVGLLGFTSEDAMQIIESFMQQDCQVAMSTDQLNELTIQHFEWVILTSENEKPPISLNSRFQPHDSHIEVTGDCIFKHTPFSILKIFVLIFRHTEIKGVRAYTILLLNKHRYLIGDDFRKDIRNTGLFIELPKWKIGFHQNFLRTNRHGVLGRYSPKFGFVVGQIQRDLFRIYVVDAHTLNLTKRLRKL